MTRKTGILLFFCVFLGFLGSFLLSVATSGSGTDIVSCQELLATNKQEADMCKTIETYFKKFFSFDQQILAEYKNAKSSFYDTFGINSCFGDTGPCGALAGSAQNNPNPFLGATAECAQCLSTIQASCPVVTDLVSILLPTEIKHLLLPICFTAPQCTLTQLPANPYLFSCAYGQSVLSQTSYYQAFDAAYNTYLQGAQTATTRSTIIKDLISFYSQPQSQYLLDNTGNLNSKVTVSSYFKTSFGTTVTSDVIKTYAQSKFTNQGVYGGTNSFDCRKYLAGGNYTFWFTTMPNVGGFYTASTGCVTITNQLASDPSTQLAPSDVALKVCATIPECAGVAFTNDLGWQQNQANIHSPSGQPMKAAVLLGKPAVLRTPTAQQQWYAATTANYAKLTSGTCSTENQLVLEAIDNTQSQLEYHVTSSGGNQLADIKPGQWYGSMGIDCSQGCVLASSAGNVVVSFDGCNKATLSTVKGSVDIPASVSGSSLYLELTLYNNEVIANSLYPYAMPFKPNSNYAVSL